MKSNRVAVATFAAAIAIPIGSLVVQGQQPASSPGPRPTQQSAQPLPPTFSAPAPLGAVNEQVFPAFEGWGPHKNGIEYALVGFFNRNKEQTIDVPIGPNNRIEPGGPDLLQPTHFEPGREWGVFTLPFPKDQPNRVYTWTLTTNGRTTQVQFSKVGPYWVDFFKNAAKGNTPPVIKFAQDGPELVGPPTGVALTLNATVNQPLKLTLWAKDHGNTYDPEEALPPEQRSARGRGARGRGNADPNAAAPDADANARGAAGRGAAPNAAAAARGGRGADQNFDLSAAQQRGTGSQNRGGGRGGGQAPDVTVTWKVHRGETPVKFADAVIRLSNQGNPDAVMEATTTATFTKAGEYILRAQVNDDSGDGGGGEQCCWTNALVRVNVK
jgi:hypothetical protein